MLCSPYSFNQWSTPNVYVFYILCWQCNCVCLLSNFVYNLDVKAGQGSATENPDGILTFLLPEMNELDD